MVLHDHYGSPSFSSARLAEVVLGLQLLEGTMDLQNAWIVSAAQFVLR